MPAIQDVPAFPALALFSVLLVLKMGAVAFATANARRKAKVVLKQLGMMVQLLMKAF